jgi:hypothetical protein
MQEATFLDRLSPDVRDILTVYIHKNTWLSGVTVAFYKPFFDMEKTFNIFFESLQRERAHVKSTKLQQWQEKLKAETVRIDPLFPVLPK